MYSRSTVQNTLKFFALSSLNRTFAVTYMLFAIEMKLHIFNPDHDIALAANLANFTPPHAARRLYSDIGFLPVFWASDGDIVVVDDAEAARERVRHIKGLSTKVEFVAASELARCLAALPEGQLTEVEPWGWDAALCNRLHRWGVPAQLLPTAELLADIRNMSSRAWAASCLQPMLEEFESGMLEVPVIARSAQQVDEFIASHEHVGTVLKSPWSSSGRGVRYISGRDALTVQQQGWIDRVIASQGCIMLEPYYINKVKDFAMEFRSCADGTIAYLGLSLFHTVNGAYSGSVVASETEKVSMLQHYASAEKLAAVASEVATVLQPLMAGHYVGPFGVDMMVLSDGGNGFKIHPCVELNLRRTMGHVALSAWRSDILQQRLLSIAYSGSYHLRLHTTTENLINTSLARF